MPLAVSTPVIGLLAVLYVILLITLGITAIREGHWIIGALMPPTHPQERMA